MQATEQGVADLYGGLWEQLSELRRHEIVEQFLSNLGLLRDWFRGRRCLDAGCGSRFAVWAMCDLESECHACDLVPASLVCVRERLGGIHGAHVAAARAVAPLLPQRLVSRLLDRLVGDRRLSNSIMPAKLSVFDNMDVPIRNESRLAEILPWFAEEGVAAADVVRGQTVLYEHRTTLIRLIHREGLLPLRAVKPSPTGDPLAPRPTGGPPRASPGRLASTAGAASKSSPPIPAACRRGSSSTGRSTAWEIPSSSTGSKHG